MTRPVATSSGELHGALTARARTFLGVRFAQPPVGPRRWTLPAAPVAPSGPVDATRAGARCAQTGEEGTASTDEDCLFLNVTTPRDLPSGRGLPVMVWWHGGGFTSGAGADYDAQRMADRGDVVVVTPNKRLGIFGYLGMPGQSGAGDLGFADQLAALDWAKRNARAFGGDPGNVTVFGESDGAMAACALLTSPAARGRVDKVAMSSGSCALDWPAGGLLPGVPAQTPYASRADNRRLSVATAKQLGCPAGRGALACLRALPVERLLPASVAFSNQLTYGTRLLPEDPAAALRAGRVARVPVLSGGTRDEARSFMGGAQQAKPATFTARSYPRRLRRAFGADASRVERAYPLARFRSPALAFATAMTDVAWACPTVRANASLARRTRVFAFEFADRGAPDVNRIDAPGVPQGAAHATDVPYLFDPGGESLLRTEAQRRLGRRMVDLWTSFARTGTPRVRGARGWTPLEAGETRGRRLAGDGIRPVDLAAEHRCGFWRGVGRAG